MADYERSCGREVFEVIKQSKICYNPTALNRFGDKYNIEFDHACDDVAEMDVIFHNSLVTSELRLRHLLVTGTLEERKQRLKKHIMVEEQLQCIKEAILHTEEGKSAALMLIKQAIPCIMHLENRVQEKIITMLLSIGANRFQRENRTEYLERYAKAIERIVQRRILGTMLRPKNWSLPINDEWKQVSDIDCNNYKVIIQCI